MIRKLPQRHRLLGISTHGSAGSVGRGFTLVELLVAVAIMTVLATLILGGLAGAKTRTKIDRTKSTIRKLNEVIMPQYESYQRRRVPAVVTGTSGPANQFTVGVISGTFFGPVPPNRTWPGTGVTGTGAVMRVFAQSRLQILRTLQVLEIPDSWGDIASTPTVVTSGSYPAYAKTGPVYAYAAVRQSVAATLSTGTNSGAECLYAIAAYGGFEPGVMANFRTDEIGDRDNDKALEFLDGWSNPITFIRWAPGVSTLYSGTNSPVQIADQVNYHDPLDPMRVDASGSTGSGARGYALTPYIASAGSDQTFGLTLTGSQGWSTLIISTSASGLTMITVTGTNLGAVSSATAVSDNVTNHDLLKK